MFVSILQRLFYLRISTLYTAVASRCATVSSLFSPSPVYRNAKSNTICHLSSSALSTGTGGHFRAQSLLSTAYYTGIGEVGEKRIKLFNSQKNSGAGNKYKQGIETRESERHEKRRSNLTEDRRHRRKFSTSVVDCGMPKRKNKVYAVVKGRLPGIYRTWADCEEQVKGFSNAIFKSFVTEEEATRYIQEHTSCAIPSENQSAKSRVRSEQDDKPKASTGKKRKMDESTRPLEDHYQNDALPPVSDTMDSSEPFYLSLPSNATIQSITVHMNFDGGSRGNPNGITGSGAHVVTRVTYSSAGATTQQKPGLQTLRIKTKIRKYLGNNSMTNNQAEYLGAIAGLEHILEILQQANQYLTSHSPSSSLRVEIIVQGDSNLVIQQLKGAWKCKDPKMQALLGQTKGVLCQILSCLKQPSSQCTSETQNLNIVYEHVYRKDNTLADGLANAAMDAKHSWVTWTAETEGDKYRDEENEDECGKKMGKIIQL